MRCPKQKTENEKPKRKTENAKPKTDTLHFPLNFATGPSTPFGGCSFAN